MIDKEKFLASHNIEFEELKAAGLNREELAAIYSDYLSIEGRLRSTGRDFVYDYLYDIKRVGIHSHRRRTKDPGYLVKKIIRERNKHFERSEDVSRDNYHKYITDLIETRVFFLYRGDRIRLHKYITSVFENDPDLYVVDRIKDSDENTGRYYTAERPKAYRKGGDTRIYDENLIEIKSGGIYRSLHYIIKYKEYYVGIRGRTLFEKGWSETDCDVVYLYFQDDEILKGFSTLLSRLSGMADEISSYLRRMKGVKEEWERQLERYNDEG